MLHKKQGYPEESDIVLCTVSKVQYNSVFVVLDEYGRSGIINIAEIAPGRIRNIRDFVIEGKKVVCKVLRVNRELGHIDLSLRRVNESQKRAKKEQIKQEQKAEKIVEIVAKEAKKPMVEIYDKIVKNMGYPLLHLCFEDVAKDVFSLEKTGLDKKIAEKMTELIKQRIRPTEVSVEGTLSIVTYAPNGIETIREALKKAQQGNVTLKYAGGGKYKIKAVAGEFKTAEAMIDKSKNAAISFVEKNNGQASFVKEKAAKATAE